MSAKARILDLNMVIGKRVREFRKRKGLNQTELAKVIKLHQTALVRIESGFQKLTAEQLFVVSKELDQPLNVFFEDLEKAV